MLDIGSILEYSNDPSFVLYRKYRDALLEKGELKGELKGKLEEKKNSLLKILQKKFGELNQDMKNEIEKIDNADKLDDLFDLSLTITNISQFKL